MSIIPRTENFTGRVTGQGEKELDHAGLDVQFYWRNEADRKRIARYEFARLMMDPDEHFDLYRKEFEDGDLHMPPKHFWIAVDFPGMLSRLMRQYTFGPEFKVRAVIDDTQPEIDRITAHNTLLPLFRRATESMPGFGDAVFKLTIENAETLSGVAIPQAVIKYVHPAHYFPDLNMFDQTKVEGVTLAWVFPLPEGAGAVSGGGFDAAGGTPPDPNRLGVLREIHTAAAEGEDSGTFRYEANMWNGKKLGSKVDLPNGLEAGPFDTGIKEIPIVHVGYQTQAGEHFGRSEFHRIKRLFMALENRLSQEDEVLEKHARPKLIVGPGLLNDEGRVNLADFDVIEVDPDIMEKAVQPSYLTWDMQIAGIQHEIEKLEEYLFMVTETSPASFGLERDGSQVESARALKFKAHRTVNKVEDFRDSDWAPAIHKLYELAQRRELVERDNDNVDGYDISPVLVNFGSVIVEDETQDVIDYVARKATGLVSRKRAIMDLDNLTPEEADREAEDILQDLVNEEAASGLGGPSTPAPAAPGISDAGSPVGTDVADRAQAAAEGTVEPSAVV